MSSERAASVAIIWIVALVVVLLGREFARASGRFDARAMRAMNVLVLVMVVAVGGIGVLVGASLLAGDRQVATSPTPDVSSTPSGPGTSPTEHPSTAAPTQRSPSPATAPPVEPSPTPDPSSTASATPTATATPAPTATPSPTPLPTPSEAATGVVEAGPSIRSYEVDGDQVTGYEDSDAGERFAAEASAPVEYAFPSLSDPNGLIRLVRVMSGPLSGTYLSPDDEGVLYSVP